MTASLTPWIAWPIVFVFHVALVGVFTGLETGIYVMNKVRLELHAEAGYPAARTLQAMLQQPNRLLANLLIGTNICFYLATFAVSALFVQAGLEHQAEWLTLAVTAPLFFVIGDSVPKNVYRRLAERIVYPLVGVLRWADRVFAVTGLNLLVRSFSEVLLRLLGQKPQADNSLLGHDELTRVLAEGHAAGALSLSQARMAENVMQLGGVRVADVYVPMRMVAWAPQEVSREQFLQQVRRHSYRRIPLLDSRQHVTGVVDIFDVLNDSHASRPADHAVSPMTLAEDTPVTQGLVAMQRARRSLAVVTDADGRHLGLVTIKDLVEEIVGDLQDW